MTRLKTSVLEAVSEQIDKLGYDLVQMERAGSSRRPILRLRIDRTEGADGVTVDDCAKVSRALETWLESAAHVPERYVLEVSSPGLDRPLTRPRDWERFAGQRAQVKTSAKVAGIGGRFEGTILESPLQDASDRVQLELDGGEVVTLNLAEVEKANLVFDWEPRG